MGLLGGRIGKLARLAVLVAALSSACMSKSEKFVSLVARGDKARAAELIRNPKSRKEYEKALAALEDLKADLSEITYKKAQLTKTLNDPFLLNVVPGFSMNFLKFKEKALRDMETLRALGLDDTAGRLAADFASGPAGLDEAVAKKLNKSQKEWAEHLRLSVPGHEREVASNMIRNAQAAIAPARQAGLNRIADACGNAAINLRGAVGK